MKLGKKIESSVCVLCVLASSVCAESCSSVITGRSFCFFLLLKACEDSPSAGTLGPSFTFTPGQSCSFFHSNMENTSECLWSDHALIKLHSHGPLMSHSRKPPGVLGTAEDVQPVGLWGDEGTEHLGKGMASVISLSLSPPSWAATDALRWWWHRAPEPQAQCTVTDWIHLSLLCFPVGSSWFLVQAHFLQSTCWGHEVTAPINQQKTNTLIQEQKEVFS